LFLNFHRVFEVQGVSLYSPLTLLIYRTESLHMPPQSVIDAMLIVTVKQTRGATKDVLQYSNNTFVTPHVCYAYYPYD
jgi:hypothetical protein